jgi:hydrogenase-1 operon protein HyaF
MTSPFTLPSGPGSQPGEEDGARLEYMEMPRGMATYHMPEVHLADTTDLGPAKRLLAAVRDALDGFKAARTGVSFDLAGMDAANLDLVDQVLGSGEVSIILADGTQMQESVLAGVWRLRQQTPDGGLIDRVEVAAIPDLVRFETFRDAAGSLAAPCELPEGVFNAPALVTEIADKLATPAMDEPHVVNLSLLPLSDGDVAFIADTLGKGRTTILSRGYGNCRVSSTNTRNVWWVQYFNSQDALILNTLEVCAVPQVALAANEDFEDSFFRLSEILEVYL